MYDKCINVKILHIKQGIGVSKVEIETEILESCSLEEIKRGFVHDSEEYICIMCGEHFEKGEIYTFSGRLYEGSKAIKVHIEQEHESVKSVLLNTSAQNMGISQLQLQLLNFFAKGFTDKEIAEKLGVSGSTIRNHRYKLRERERQNKLFLALMETLKQENILSKIQKEPAKANASYAVSIISDKERKRIQSRYMTSPDKLDSYPDFEKNKRIVLEAILVHFSVGKRYSEDEINEILGGIYKDYKLLRNELMTYGYLDRTNKGAIYWVKDYEVV